MKEIVIYGAENGFAADLVETLRRLDWPIAAAVLRETPEWSLQGMPRVIHEDEVSPDLSDLPVAVPDVNPGLRKEKVARLRELGFSGFPSIVDPTAVMPDGLRMGVGVYVNAGAVLGSEVRLGDHACVNRAASLGHHTTLEGYATVGPGCAVASRCVLGQGAFLGVGATVSVSCRIGANAVIGAGAVVIREVPGNTVSVGNPARIIKNDVAGYGGKSV